MTMRATEDFAVPDFTVAHRYVLHDRLGVGGMGEVWRARDRVTDADVALKILIASVAGAPAAELRFQREIEAMARLDHPAIVPIIDAGRDPRVGLYFVMSLIEGEPMHEVSYQWRSWATLWPVADRVLDALGHAHARGVVHRDVKPDNILIDRAGDAFLLDFGVARLKDQARSGTSAHDMLGTIDYAAPEQARGNRRRIGPWTDIYAFAIVLYEIICGRLPFHAPSAVQSLMMRLDRGCPRLDPRPGFSTPVGLLAALDAMMRPDIHDRLQVVEDVRALLAGLNRAPLEVLNIGGGPTFGVPLAVSAEGTPADTAVTDYAAISLLERWGSPGPEFEEAGHGVRSLQPPLRPPTVHGRDKLLMGLTRGLDRWAKDPQAGVLVVAGPSGCGKSRLCEELLVSLLAGGRLESHRHDCRLTRHAESRHWEVALSIVGGLGMEPQARRDQMSWFLQGRGVTDEARRRDLIDWLASKEGDLGLPGEAGSKTPDGQLQRLVELLRICAHRPRPFVLFLDGLEVLDASVVHLLEAVRDARLPIVVLLTVTDVEGPTGVERPAWLTSGTRSLPALDDASIRQICDDIVDLDSVDRDRLVSEAEGNPSRLIKALNVLRHEGRVVPAHPRWVRAPAWWATRA